MPAASNRRVLLAATGALILAAAPARAQTYFFYGTPSEAYKAQMMLNLKTGLQSAVNLQQSVAVNNYSMMADRKTIEAACSSGSHDFATEARLADELRGKDVYYLVLYSQQAGLFSSRSNLTKLEALGGAPLDHGIRPSAEFAFSRWALSVNKAMGSAFSSSSGKLADAIASSADYYLDYVFERDRAEIGELSQNISYQTPPKIHDPSPKVLADAYISMVIDPAIARLSNPSPEELASLHAWEEDVRASIVAFEQVQLDPQKIALRVRQDNPRAPAVADAFLRNATAHLENGIANQADIERAYDGSWDAGLAPGRTKQLMTMKYVSDPSSFIHLQQIQSRDAMSRLHLNPVDMFYGRREDIIDTIKATSGEMDDDWCTGQPLTATSR